MKKISFLFLIVLATLFVSCNKEDATISDKTEISYSDTIEVFSADKLSSVVVAISSNDAESFNDLLNSLTVLTDIEDIDDFNDLKSQEINETSLSENYVSSNIDVSVDILKINTELKAIALGRKDIGLKSIAIAKPHTYHYSCIESKYLFYVRYNHNGASELGLKVYMGHLDCMLCSWEMQNYLLFNSPQQNQQLIANPWNAHKSVYKVGANLVTDLGDSENFTVVLYARPQ